MNNFILFRSNNNIEKDNYKIIFILIIFFIFRIFGLIIYNDNLYLIFKPIIFYIIYSVIEIVFLKIFKKNRRIDNYFIISSLIISYILPSSTPISLFIICSIIGNVISFLSNNRINCVVITSLCIFYYLSINNILYIDKYSDIFNIVYILLWIISFIYLLSNKLIKSKVLLSSIISIIIVYFINGNYLFDNILFCLLFILSDNRYTPIKGYGEISIGVIFGILMYILKLEYSLFLIILICEILSIIINYLSVRIKYKKCQINV